MVTLIRMILALALAIVLFMVVLVVVKVAVGVAILLAVAFGAIWVVNFIAAFARRLRAAERREPVMLGSSTQR